MVSFMLKDLEKLPDLHIFLKASDFCTRDHNLAGRMFFEVENGLYHRCLLRF
jgi:hypothetical protein